MTAAGIEKTASLRHDSRPLFWAFLISVGIHFSLFGMLVLVGVATTVFSSSLRQVLAEAKLQEQMRAKATPKEPQLVFVEVDPAQAAPEAPKDAKYYSAHNTVAANPDADKDTGVPKIDGTQTHVMQTKDIPRTQQFPLQPSPPKESPPSEKQPDTAKPETPQPPGDLALMTKPTRPAEQNPAPAQPAEHQRPHTLAEVQQVKMKEDGGVARHRVASSLDTKGSPLGEYDERIVAAIREYWYKELYDLSVPPDHFGKVVIEFRLHYNGSVTDEKVLESTVGQGLSDLCYRAILNPSPYDKWPDAMRRMIDAPYREVTFTFYYE